MNDIIDGLDAAGAPRFIVLEDFHYLPEETQRDFAVALKAFHESSTYSFIVVGVWLDQNRMTQHNGDLSGRVLSVNADTWTSSELRQVIHEGGQLLNVEFHSDFVEDLVASAFESVWIVQEVCKQACEQSGVFRKQQDRVGVTADAATLIKAAVDQESARFNGFLAKFPEGFQSAELEMYRWILGAVLSADLEQLERGLSYAEITKFINANHPKAPVNPGNITQALTSTAKLQISKLALKPIILDYDQTSRALNVVDRSFLIWLRHQDREYMISMVGIDSQRDGKTEASARETGTDA